MDGQDLLPLPNVRHFDHDLSVESSGPEERRVQHVRTVRRRQYDDTVLGVETVHLHKHLVEGLLSLVMAAAVARAADTADRVQFVDEQDAGRALAALLEEVPDSAGAHADEHFHEIGAGHVEKGDIRLSRHGLGQQGLAGARHSDEQYALGDVGSQLQELLGVLEVVHDLVSSYLASFCPATSSKVVFFETSR